MATSAEDGGDDVGQISDGSDLDIEFTDGEELRRLLPAERNDLLGGMEGGGSGGEGGEGEGGDAGVGGDAGGRGGEGGDSDSEDDPEDPGGSDEDEADDFSEESETTISVSDLDETHPPDPGSCPNACGGDFIEDCDCECELCMFKYRNARPPDMIQFEQCLRANFQDSTSTHLTDLPVRRFRARRPYDDSVEDTGHDCTQMIPWLFPLDGWREPCDNVSGSEDGDEGNHDVKVLPCLEKFCKDDLKALGRKYRNKKRSKSGGKKKLPKNLLRNREMGNGSRSKHYVCEKHIQDSKKFFCMGRKLDNLYKAHLIRFCEVHEAQLIEARRQRGGSGETTCTCRNIDFTRWQCRTCFTTKVEKLQRHFRRRVNAKWRGCANKEDIKGSKYQWGWRKVRTMLQRLHPCLKGFCGRARLQGLQGLVKNEILDCRCCGGHIVQPEVPLRRSARLSGRRRVAYGK